MQKRKSENGKVVGVLCVNLKVNQITTFINGLTKNNQIFVSNNEGYIIAAKYPDYLGKNLLKLRPTYTQFKNKEQSSHSYNFENKEYFVVSSLMTTLGWTTWAWDEWDNINAASNRTLTISVVIAIVAIVLSLVFTSLLVIKIMYRPIGGEPRVIEALVKKVAAGNLSLTFEDESTATGIYAAIITMVNNLKNTVIGINSTSEQVNNSAEHINKSAIIVTKSSESQLIRLEQVSTAMNEMTVTVQEVSRNTQEVLQATDKANIHSEQGINVVNETNINIKNLVDGIENVQSQLDKLAEESQNIGTILDVIRSIADQTNLLALNAAIEAARAGEQGRGFAVVVDEVRTLASRTQESTNEIQEMISRLQTQAKNSVVLIQTNVDAAKVTVEKSATAHQTLEAISRSVIAINGMNHQIATAAEEQSIVADDINASIVSIHELAKNTFDCSENNTKMATTLEAAATSLNESVEVFKIQFLSHHLTKTLIKT
jgi:methyl-accepting chemotaxis protein